FAVPLATVIADIRQQVAAGARHITFTDPDFLNGPTHALRIARALHDAFPGTTFDFTAKVEHLLRHRRLLPEFARLGCAFVVTAVESLSDRVLRCLEKGHTRQDVFQVVRAARAAGLTLRPSLLPFTPWSTLADYRELLDWIEGEELVECVDAVQLGIRLLVPPGSALLGKPWMTPHLGELDPEALTFRWAHPDARMDRLYEAVNAIVTEAAGRGADGWTTFGRIRRAAELVAGGWRGRGGRGRSAAGRIRSARPAPRLTEPWFC
ncbi:MAG TPA: radical SAM protein, partial [Gemmatimonadales bacterium]|nr:radical SAM protein [Gemmatimonadales bacterium]